MPGEVVRPVSATRSGWATAPSLRLFAPRNSASRLRWFALHRLTASSAARSLPISARVSGVSRASALARSRADGRQR